MSMKRGDVVLVHYPFSSGTGAKLRPALVVQNDRNNQRLTNVIVAAITSTTHRSGEPTQFLIEVTSAAGTQSGLVKDSVVTCENLATVEQNRVSRVIGSLPDEAMTLINECLKASLEIR
jgi:mRNA interferase MazF